MGLILLYGGPRPMKCPACSAFWQVVTTRPWMYVGDLLTCGRCDTVFDVVEPFSMRWPMPDFAEHGGMW